MAAEGNPVPTGWEPLDRQFRHNGISPGRILTVGGPPFAGKTTVVAQLAYHMAARSAVYGLFSDEGRTQAAVRIGLMSGIPVHRIETEPAAASKEIEEAMGERSIVLRKPDTELSTATHLIDTIRAKKTAAQVVVALDSVQTIALAGDGVDDSPRLSAKSFMGTVRKWAAELGYIFLLTSQSNRASYRHKKGEENTYAIASFSESSAIEYLSDIAIVLSIPDENEIVTVEFVKNRLKGTANKFFIKYDPTSGRMIEVEGPPEVDDRPAKTEARAKALARDNEHRFAELQTDIERLVKKHGEFSTNDIARETGGRKADVLAVLRAMEASKALDAHKKGQTIVWSIHQEDKK
jgi:KaiC/GvpD/RAD55 family RecA-like ATPase